MKKFELKTIKHLVRQAPYTFNSFNDDIRDFDIYINYLKSNYKTFDFTKVDKFVDYIYEIIDKMDYLFINWLEYSKELNIYLNNLNYVYYDEIKISDNFERVFNTKYMFDIRDKKSKQFLKDNITFNIGDECCEPFLINTDRKYILNDDNRLVFNYNQTITTYCEYCFVKDNYLKVIFFQQDGYIEDYRDIDELTFLKRKDLKVKNKNYNTYDYTKFSNDIDDDKYINYIYDIIDNSNYMFARSLPFEEKKRCQENLNFIYYDKILLEDKSKDFDTNYIFNIKDKKAKDFIKDKIKFNLSNKDKKPMLVNSNKKYILNEIGKKEYEYVNYGFIKNDYLEVVLHQENGYIYDYRPYSIREKEIKKYKN